MNFIGIDVSQGKSHATQITDDFEQKMFSFAHNKSGFNDLSTHFTSDTIQMHLSVIYNKRG